MKINYKYLSIFCWLTWLGFLLFLILDSMKIFGLADIGFVETLRTSTLSRGMFTDIGILSTIIAGWMIFGTNLKSKWIFAILTICIGSLGALPFLAIYFRTKINE